MSYPRELTPRRLWKIAALAAVLTAAIVTTLAFVIITVAVMMRASAPRFSVVEQEFLIEVKHEQPAATWPSDSEMVRQAHEVCSLQDRGVEKDRLIDEVPFVGRPEVPDFLRPYTYTQRTDFVYIATRHLCPQYSLWVGGIPL